jgi:carbonic anhydrase
MSRLDKILAHNKSWARDLKSKDPLYFEDMAKGQEPEYLWIGCSDSRVEASRLTGLTQGNLFVHRNIANIFYPNDNNMSAVLQFSIEVLKVKKVIVCGHYGCGGINAALDGGAHGLIDNWLHHIKDVYRFHEQKLDAIEDTKERANTMCELNVIEQVANVCHTTILRNAWENNQDITVHGFIYKLHDGILKDLEVSVSDNG